MPTHVPLILILLLALPLAGCSVSIGGAKELDAEQVATDIRAAYKEQTSLALKELDCAPIKLEVGAPLRCNARNERDVRLRIEGDVRELRDDRARYRWEVTKAIAPGVLFERSLADVLEPRARFRIDAIGCPAEVEIREGASTDCDVQPVGGGDPWRVTFRQTDGDGKFTVTEFTSQRRAGQGAAGATT